MKTLVQLSDVSVTFQGIPALRHIDFTLREGQHTLILGRNGSGKSTLLRLLRGEIYPDQKEGGSVCWFPDGAPDSSPLTGHEMTAMVSPGLQNYYARQAWNINAMEVILAARTDDYILYRTPSEDEREEVRALARGLGAEKLLDRRIAAFSQGQMRITLILRALARRAPILLLDEILCGLDAEAKGLVMDFLDALAASSSSRFFSPSSPSSAAFSIPVPTLVMVKHRLPLPGFIRRIIRLEQGRIAAEETPAAIPVPVGTASAGTAPELLSDAELQPAAKGVFPAFLRRKRAPLRITLDNASVYIEHVEILRHVNWVIEPGQQWAVRGRNGSGKSTLLLALLGLLPAALGGTLTREILSGPDAPRRLAELNEIRRRIGYVSDALQTHYTYNDKVEDVIFCGIDGDIGVHRQPLPEESGEVGQMLDFLGLRSLRERPVRSLSSGQARRVLLGRALMGRPSMLLLDEPFSGLDSQSRAFMSGVLDCCIGAGIQTVTVSHHPEDFPASATHTAVLEQGILTVERSGFEKA